MTNALIVIYAQNGFTKCGNLASPFDGPGHPAPDVQRFALAHMRDVLGAEVVEEPAE